MTGIKNFLKFLATKDGTDLWGKSQVTPGREAEESKGPKPLNDVCEEYKICMSRTLFVPPGHRNHASQFTNI